MWKVEGVSEVSLDKAIASGKEHRRSYRQRGKAGEHDRTCRPHGGGSAHPCPWCERSRLRWRHMMADAMKINADHSAHDYVREEFDADACTEDSPCAACREDMT